MIANQCFMWGCEQTSCIRIFGTHPKLMNECNVQVCNACYCDIRNKMSILDHDSDSLKF